MIGLLDAKNSTLSRSLSGGVIYDKMTSPELVPAAASSDELRRKTETESELEFAVAKSVYPSWLKSAEVMERGESPAL